ncbi:MAG: N-acetylneuraminate synthase family protein [Pseudomonadota bacterium]
MKQIDLDNYVIGDDCPVFIVAEVGINHNGDMVLAKESIAAAAESGADSVKFQNFRVEDFISDRSLMFEYRSQDKKVVESQYDMFKRCELNRDQLADLKTCCDSHGVLFHSTPTSIEGIAELREIDCRLLKNGSDYLTNLDLVRAMGESGLPTVLSTGMSTLSEIDDAVQTFRDTGNDHLVLLHCTSSYPTPADEVNLARIETLAQTFGCLAGFSDHSHGINAALGATVLGSCWIEKHYTLDRNLPGPDHWFSMDPDELACLTKAVRETSKMIGSPRIVPTSSEKHSRREYKLSCVASRNLEPNVIVSEDDIEFRRPGYGVPPKDKHSICGMQLRRRIEKGTPFTMNDFCEPGHESR